MRAGIIVLTLATLAAAGCAHSTKDQPAWVQQRLANISDTYPNLHDVPHGNNANTDRAHWAAVQADVQAAGAAMRADPRSQPAPPNDANTFIDDAHNAIDQTRDSHGPN